MANGKKSKRRRADLLTGPASLPHSPGRAPWKKTRGVPRIDVNMKRSVVGNFDAGEKLRASTAAKPCAAGRDTTGRMTGATRCPVQLTFIKGKPFIRACAERTLSHRGQPGILVEVKNPADAVKTSNAICACWRRAGGMKAKANWVENCGPLKKNHGLGRLR
jgi:hypothetical protein